MLWFQKSSLLTFLVKPQTFTGHKCFETSHIQLYISHNQEQYCVHPCLNKGNEEGNTSFLNFRAKDNMSMWGKWKHYGVTFASNTSWNQDAASQNCWEEKRLLTSHLCHMVSSPMSVRRVRNDVMTGNALILMIDTRVWYIMQKARSPAAFISNVHVTWRILKAERFGQTRTTTGVHDEWV